MVQAKQHPHIVHVHLDYGLQGGIEQWLIAQMKQLRGHYRFSVVSCQDTPFFHNMQRLGIPCYGISPLGLQWFALGNPHVRFLDLWLWWQLLPLLAKLAPDIVHLHIGMVEPIVLKGFGHRVIETFHGYGTLYYRMPNTPWFRGIAKSFSSWVCKTFSRFIDALLVVSPAEKSLLEAQHFLQPNQANVHVMCNAVDVKTISTPLPFAEQQHWRNTWQIPLEAMIITFASRLDPIKNPCTFIAYAEALTQAYPEKTFVFMIAGQGPLHGDVVEAIAASPIKSSFRLLGHIQNPLDLFKLSDWGVFISDMEGFGLSVLECLASGTFCITHNVGGVGMLMDFPNAAPLIIPDGQTPTLSADEKEAYFLPKLMAASAYIMGMTPNQRAALREACIAQAYRFDIDVFAQTMHTHYQRVLGKTR